MNAAIADLQDDAFLAAQKLLYQWGDDCRSKADTLGLPASSGISRMIEQQRVFDRQRRGQHAKGKEEQKLRQPITLKDGTKAIVCLCGKIHLRDERCPRCGGDPREPDRSVHATATRSFRAPSIGSISAASAAIDAIVATAPNELRKMLMRGFLFVQRDQVAARQLRLRLATYQEAKAAAVEYVMHELARNELTGVYSPPSRL